LVTSDNGNMSKGMNMGNRDACTCGRGEAATALRDASPIVLSPQQTLELKQVIKHVEYYQPLYGIQVTPKPLRSCRDRAEVIAAAMETLDGERRLIDFGSSLGYFVFYFADRGVVAEGLECGPANVAVAETVRRINGLDCSFHCAELTLEYVRDLPAGKYEVGLILSVLHHIVHQHGLAYAAELMAELIERIPMLIVELAHREEPVNFAWRDSQPADPLAVLSACRNIRMKKLGEFETHLSHVRRALWCIEKDTSEAS
jgi:hypothetical protein